MMESKKYFSSLFTWRSFGFGFICALLLGFMLFVLLWPVYTSDRIPVVGAAHNREYRVEDWKNSSESERYAYLSGALGAIRLEADWQGIKQLPLKSSLAGSWTEALSGVSIDEMCTSVNMYIAAHPDNIEYDILHVLWDIYAVPRLASPAQSKSTLRRLQQAGLKSNK